MLHTLVHLLQWGTVPAWIGAGITVVQARSARRQAEKAKGDADRKMQAAEAEMAWRISWINVIKWTETDKGHYELTNKSETPKYGVSVEGLAGTNRWDVIYEGKSASLANPYEEETDKPFTVSWHVKQDQSDSPPRTTKVWATKSGGL